MRIHFDKLLKKILSKSEKGNNSRSTVMSWSRDYQLHDLNM